MPKITLTYSTGAPWTQHTQKFKCGTRTTLYHFILRGCSSFRIISGLVHICLCVLLDLFVCECVFEASSAGWRAGRVRFCSYWSVSRNCNAAVFPKKRSVLPDRNMVLCYYHILSPFMSLSLERGTELSEAEIWIWSEWPFGRRSQTHSVIRCINTWYCMFIKCSRRYKQEKCHCAFEKTEQKHRWPSDNGLWLISPLWVSGTGESTWLQSENWRDYRLIYPATLQLRAPSWAILAVTNMERRRGSDSPKFSLICFQKQLHPPSHSPSRSLISHAIDWNPKRQDQGRAQSSLSMNSWLDAMVMLVCCFFKGISGQRAGGGGDGGAGRGGIFGDTAMWRVVLSHPVLSCVVEAHRGSCHSLIRSSGVLRMRARSALVSACEGT